MNFFSKPIYELEPTAFGLDITDVTIRAVQLDRIAPHQVRLSSFTEVVLPPGLIEQGEIKSESAVIDVLKDLRKKTQFGSLKSKFVVASLPEQDAFMQVVSVPKMKKEEIDQAIRWEVEGNIPVNVEEAYFDWQNVDPIKKTPDHTDVLVAASPRHIVDSYVSVLNSANFSIKALEIESTATTRALFPGAFSSKPVLVVDLGAARTSFIIFSGSAIRFTSSIPTSGSQMTQAIAQAVGVNADEAEKIKREAGLDKTKREGKVFKALEPVLESLISEITKHLSFYKTHSFHEHGQFHNISKIILSGGGANLKGLTAYLGAQFKLSVEIGNPWANILEAPVKYLPPLPFDRSLSFVTAIGLALRGLPLYTNQ
ncbi:type IV pilus assembly protein PilM [Candidatus Parcubacteria bacterium]|nr:MAG: type IV pilus assembly protein PilM [Candidatus Parcubacteria bacterium]